MRICSGVGCLRAVPDDVRFCDECRSTTKDDGIRSHTNGYTTELDELRKSLRWQKVRARVVREQPLCARCHKALTTIVDHIVPAQIAVMQAQLSGKFLDRSAGYFLRSNLQGLCRACHYAKTIEDKGHSGDWPDVVDRDTRAVKRVWTF